MILLAPERTKARRAKARLPERAKTRGGRAEETRSKTRVDRFLPIQSTRGAAARDHRAEAAEPVSMRVPRPLSDTPHSLR